MMKSSTVGFCHQIITILTFALAYPYTFFVKLFKHKLLRQKEIKTLIQETRRSPFAFFAKVLRSP